MCDEWAHRVLGLSLLFLASEIYRNRFLFLWGILVTWPNCCSSDLSILDVASWN